MNDTALRLLAFVLLVPATAHGQDLAERLGKVTTVTIRFDSPEGRVDLKEAGQVRGAIAIIEEAGLVALAADMKKLYALGKFQHSGDGPSRWHEVNGFRVMTGSRPCCGNMTIRYLDAKGIEVLVLQGSANEDRPTELILDVDLPARREDSIWPIVELPRESWRALERRFALLLPGEGEGEGLAKKLRLALGRTTLAEVLRNLRDQTGASIAWADDLHPANIQVTGDVFVPQPALDLLMDLARKASLTINASSDTVTLAWTENAKKRLPIQAALETKRAKAAKDTLAFMARIGARGVDPDSVASGIKGDEVIVTARLTTIEAFPRAGGGTTDVIIGIQLEKVLWKAEGLGFIAPDETMPLPLHYEVKDEDLGALARMVKSVEDLELVIVGKVIQVDCRGTVLSGGGCSEFCVNPGKGLAPRWFPVSTLPCFEDLAEIEKLKD